MMRKTITRFVMALGLGALAVQPVQAGTQQDYAASFDAVLGTELRAPKDFHRAYSNPLEARIAQLADGGQGRIGVAAVDLADGHEITVLGEQRFPMASTSKIAIAATFLDGVDKGRWSLTSEYPLLIPVRSQPFSSAAAPVRKGAYLPAHELIERMITRSDNTATDALLAVIGGPEAVTRWVHKAGIDDFRIDRDIATLVRDDGEFDPAKHIDPRDSATPHAMVQLLSGLYEGRWLSKESREVLIGAMERCVTGKRRIRALLPEEVQVAHKTGSLNNTSSDIGIIKTPDGRAYAVAIYVTGQGSRLARENRIAQIAKAIFDGYTELAANDNTHWVNARY